MNRTALLKSLLVSWGACCALANGVIAAPRDNGSAKTALEPAAELTAIRAESEAFVAAFNKRDAKAVAALWTEDGEYMDDIGRHFVGRDAIGQAYSDFFDNSPHATMRVMIDSLRLLSDSTAIEDGRAVVDPPPAGAPAYSKYTVVHVKVDGKWRMASVRDTHVELSSAYRKVADLEWLIGDWTAEEHGRELVSVFQWVANKSFVERKHTVTHAGHTVSSGVQLIGYNPLTGRVQSWDFSSDGGYAVGDWAPHASGWLADVHGVTGDGIRTRASVRLTRLDDNAYVWQSFDRTAGDVSLPDSDEIVIRRKAAK